MRPALHIHLLNKRALIVAGLLVAMHSVSAQESIPTEVRQEVLHMYPAMEIVDAFEEGQDLGVVLLGDGQQYKIAYFNAAGKWEFTRWSIERDEVPLLILGVLDSIMPEFRIESINREQGSEVVRYVFNMSDGAKNELVVLSSEGDLIKKVALADLDEE
ncbi:MAG: hypothetical protein H6585_13200 [Flavobacteriales bacterium]|nr:hypothetical protein [Flavobacteriales bacterium]MCB9449290.1 hypothetical protein [Flavobacteriales bacterium]